MKSAIEQAAEIVAISQFSQPEQAAGLGLPWSNSPRTRLVCGPVLLHGQAHDAVAGDCFQQLLDLIELLVLIDWSDLTVCTIFGNDHSVCGDEI
jgi:hypothetical protein